ncbi:uncharacterized protein LY79DRAFT_572556 [Colletotrichum navitas]|uniref:Ankyrin repeat protein n=1 Tax=Colletotrichum navitas TaxID=681940 RepID=A0AAD8PKK0_9PEZI|nr:uncharacterized protein LY79DRAFT_572556 [Colletotrichum navitas]KAK1566202.1 hypothetical protein LY79DRAFT_572556 [Colletotrichum navitas]
MVRHLLREGADINFCHFSDACNLNVPASRCKNLGETALQAAILGTNTKVVLFLLAAGARRLGGELALAIRSRQQIITEALLAEGASLGDNSAAYECGSVLEAAVMAQDVDLISLIIQTDAKAVDECALWAAMFVAKYSSDSPIIHIITAQYTRLRVVNGLWLGTAIHLAAQLDLREISEALLATGMHPTISLL